MNALEFPVNIDAKTGNGFKLNLNSTKVVTKYTYGVSLMILPFYLAADLYSQLSLKSTDGFSESYCKAIDFAAVFYLTIALYLLGKTLLPRVGLKTTVTTLFFTVFGTNVFYYAIDETGMSHIYSFFLFSALIHLFWVTLPKSISIANIILLGLITAMIILIRPTSIIFVIILLILKRNLLTIIFESGILKFSSRAFALTFAFILIFLPQFLYWQYTDGVWVKYSYGSETFKWLRPDFLRLVFAPQNGLLPYSPLFLVIFIFLVFRVNEPESRLLLIGIISMTYTFSCWWDVGFGCSFGSRNYVEYFALLTIPFAELLRTTDNKGPTKKALLYCFLFICVALNIKMTYTYDGCFYGSVWDWESYLSLIFSQTK